MNMNEHFVDGINQPQMQTRKKCVEDLPYRIQSVLSSPSRGTERKQYMYNFSRGTWAVEKDKKS